LGDSLLERGIQAARTGQHEAARTLLARAVRRRPDSARAWLWLGSVVDDKQHRLHCLRQALRIDPHNETVARATQALAAQLEAKSTQSGDSSDGASVIEPVTDAPRGAPWKPIVAVLPFTLRRIAFGVLVLLAIIYLTYLGLDMVGGTRFGPAAGHAVPKTLEYVGRLLRGDLGMTTAGSDTWAPRPVIEVIVERLPRSLGLLGLSLLLAALVGLVLGVLSARGRSQRSLGVLIATLIGVSVPSFFAAFLLQWGAITWTRKTGRPLLPVGGYGWDARVVLPVLVLAARPIAHITRMAFVSVREVLGEDYVRAAHSKGLRDLRVMAGHVMRNAWIPILTAIVVSLTFCLSSLPVVELYFGWQGVGFTLLKGIARQDANLTIALVLCLGLLFILVNVILETSYRLIDPRLLDPPVQGITGDKQTLLEALRSAVDAVHNLITENTLVRWFERQRGRRESGESPAKRRRRPKRKAWVSPTSDARLGRRPLLGTLTRNPPLIVGGLLVLGFVAVVFLGPRLSPNSPYHTQRLIKIDGEWASPPFAPNETYPWGTDALGRGIMSLILAGAQQTLVLAVLAVAARTGVGVVLGAVAGWRQGSAVDRSIQGLSEVIAAFPTLLLAMILILALGVRRGMPPFIIALCFVGWGAIMQYVRSQVIVIRRQPYIESAIAIGARTPRIVIRHVLPHLFAALTAIIALEMGAVLMLLGELGFIRIFIGGGIVAAPIPGRRLLYSDVPEWGALLSDLRYLARTYPWTALYPMAAFTLAILSFNLFGEGIRRLLEKGDLVVNRLVNRYTVAALAAVLVGLGWLNSHSGSMAFYEQHARAFDGQRALDHAAALTAPAMEGRALGTPGMDAAAAYIATEFEVLGLQAAGQEGTYYQQRARSFERPITAPALEIDDGGPLLTHRIDYATYPGPESTVGQAQGPVRFVGLGAQGQVEHGAWRPVYANLDRADFSGEVLLVLSAREAAFLDRFPKEGVLVVTEDPAQLGERYTVGGRNPSPRRSCPRLWISEQVADRLLASTGQRVAELRDRTAELPMEGVFELTSPTRASLQVESQWEKKWPVQHVIGYLPGTHSYDFCYDCLGKQLILVMAQYDSPVPGPGDATHPAANDNASGVAVMLEAIRVMQGTDYQPYKTFLFVAYSGEGLEGGEYVHDPDVDRFLRARAGLSSHELEAIVEVQGLGGGSGDRLEVASSGSLRLAKLAERCARLAGVGAVRVDEAIDIGFIYDEGGSFDRGGEDVPRVRLYWEGWEEHARTPADTLDTLSVTSLEKAGRTLATTLMVLGRETEY
jgi:peptide/nickel transport system permease protein